MNESFPKIKNERTVTSIMMCIIFWTFRVCSLLTLVSLVKSSSVGSDIRIMGNKMSSSSSNDDVVTLKDESGASAKIYLYGATITSFVTASKKEILFVSEKAIVDGSKAIRGGIPLVFPIFGPPTDESSDMPQHGFARNNRWTLITSNNNEAILELNYKNHVMNGIGTKGFWSLKEDGSHDVTLRLTVRIQAEFISTTLDITNTSNNNTPLENLQALFHTYYQIDNHAALNPDACAVLSGSDGYSIIDKVNGSSPSSSSCHPPNTPITVTGEVDRIYNPPTDKKSLNVILQTGTNSKIDLKAEASIVGSPLPVSVVVWNPHIEKAKNMGDFGDEQYHDMLCVEPGILNDVPLLQPNQTLHFTQTISTL